MPDNRDQSRQKRSKENRANRAAVEARKAAVAKKAEPVEEPTGKGKRKTRAQAAPVRGSGGGRSGGNGKAASSAGSDSSAGSPRAAAAPAPVEVDPSAPWFRRILSVPGGRAVLVSFLLSLGVTVLLLAIPANRSVERYSSHLKGKQIEHCVTTKGKKIALKEGQTVEQVCGYKDLTDAQRKSDKRALAVVHGRLLDLYGGVVALYMVMPIVASGAALALATRPNRRRVFGYASLLYAFWMLMFSAGLGLFYIVSFGALVFAWYQARKADPPVRPERRSGGGGGLGGLFGLGRNRGGDDVIDADVVDEGGAGKS